MNRYTETLFSVSLSFFLSYLTVSVSYLMILLVLALTRTQGSVSLVRGSILRVFRNSHAGIFDDTFGYFRPHDAAWPRFARRHRQHAYVLRHVRLCFNSPQTIVSPLSLSPLV